MVKITVKLKLTLQFQGTKKRTETNKKVGCKKQCVATILEISFSSELIALTKLSHLFECHKLFGEAKGEKRQEENENEPGHLHTGINTRCQKLCELRERAKKKKPIEYNTYTDILSSLSK